MKAEIQGNPIKKPNVFDYFFAFLDWFFPSRLKFDIPPQLIEPSNVVVEEDFKNTIIQDKPSLNTSPICVILPVYSL